MAPVLVRETRGLRPRPGNRVSPAGATAIGSLTHLRAAIAVGSLIAALLAGPAGAIAPASIVIDSMEVSPPERTGVPQGSAASFDIIIVLQNEGEQAGTAELVISGMYGLIANETIFLAGGRSVTKTYPWILKGDRRHSCMATITGDVGAPSNMPAAADLHYAAATPGFGAPLLLFTMAGAAALAAGGRR